MVKYSAGRAWAWVRRNVFAALLTIIVLGGSGMYVASTLALNRATTCQAEYNRAFVAALVERARASAVERDSNRAEKAANRNLVRTILANANDPNARRRALEEYVARSEESDRAGDEADRTRELHPIPTNAC